MKKELKEELEKINKVILILVALIAILIIYTIPEFKKFTIASVLEDSDFDIKINKDVNENGVIRNRWTLCIRGIPYQEIDANKYLYLDKDGNYNYRRCFIMDTTHLIVERVLMIIAFIIEIIFYKAVKSKKIKLENLYMCFICSFYLGMNLYLIKLFLDYYMMKKYFPLNNYIDYRSDLTELITASIIIMPVNMINYLIICNEQEKGIK